MSNAIGERSWKRFALRLFFAPCRPPVLFPRSARSLLYDGSRSSLSLRHPRRTSISQCPESKRIWILPAMSSDSGGQRAILSIDVGTSATKAALCFVDQKGQLGPVSRVAHETYSLCNRQITQRVGDWMHAAVKASRDALAAAPEGLELAAIAVTGQMQDLIAVGPNPPALLSSDAILYSDARAQKAAAALSDRCGAFIDATSIVAKLSLLPPPTTNGAPDYSLLLGAADYIIHAFAAEPKPVVTDATTVSTTGLTRPPHRAYDSEQLAAAGFSTFEPLLPAILAAPRMTGRLCTSVAAQLGRADLAGTPLVHAGGDAYSTTVGAGCDAGGRAYVYCGTSGWVGGTARAGVARGGDGLFELGHCADDGLCVQVASLAAVGGSVAFACETLLGGLEVAELDEIAGRADVGASGVVYVPYVTGRRCPRPDARAGGALVGLSVSTRREDVARAVVEGVAFAFAEAAMALPEGVLGEGGPLRMVGGGAKCETLVRGVAALLGGENGVVRAAGGEDSAVGIIGAARVAASAVGVGSGDWWIDGPLVVVEQEERRRWAEAWERWQAVVAAVERVW